jgi:hypothetical protein
MPAFLDFHSLGRYSEADLKEGFNRNRDEYGVKVLNIFYDMESRMMFCLFEAPDRDVIREIRSTV